MGPARALAKTTGELPQLSQEDYALIKRTCGGGKLNDDEMRLFLFKCQLGGVHPLSRLIYAQVYVQQSTGERTLTFVTSIDYMRAKADETGEYAPGSPTEYEYNKAGSLLVARAHVLKWVKGTMIEFSEEATWAEFCPDNEKNQRMWKKMPRVMLAKCAEARALRRGWSRQLHGLYAEEEMHQAEDEGGVLQRVSKRGEEPWPQDDGEALTRIRQELASRRSSKGIGAWARLHVRDIQDRGPEFAKKVHEMIVERKKEFVGADLAGFQPTPEEKAFIDAMIAEFAKYTCVEEFDIWTDSLDENVVAGWRTEMKKHVETRWQQARTTTALKGETAPPAEGV